MKIHLSEPEFKEFWNGFKGRDDLGISRELEVKVMETGYRGEWTGRSITFKATPKTVEKPTQSE